MMVLLPQPEAPTMPTDWPFWMLRFKPLRTLWSGLLAYAKLTFRNSMTGACSDPVLAILLPVEVLIGGLDSRKAIIWFAAACALETSEENPKRMPAVCEPMRTAMNAMKKSRRAYSPCDKSFPPYQNAKLVTARLMLSAKAWTSIVTILLRSSRCEHSSRRDWKESSTLCSSVKLETVRIELTASDAKRAHSRYMSFRRSWFAISRRRRKYPAQKSVGMPAATMTKPNFQATAIAKTEVEMTSTTIMMIRAILVLTRFRIASGCKESRLVISAAPCPRTSKKATS